MVQMISYGRSELTPYNPKHLMRSQLFHTLLCLFLCSAALPDAAAAQNPKPNIVYIFADDLGWTDLGCQGSKYYETPNIDRLASQGMRMLRCYSSQNCAPTRAALMSGQYAPRTGVYTVDSLDRGIAENRRMTTPDNSKRLSLDRRAGAAAAATRVRNRSS